LKGTEPADPGAAALANLEVFKAKLIAERRRGPAPLARTRMRARITLLSSNGFQDNV
jgi:hypothetical protein